jgi:putative DNA primase/helicase
MINAQQAVASASVHVVSTNGLDIKPEKPRHGLKVLSISELLSLELPPREYLLSPIVPMRGLAMLYAPRGIGKTYLALSISYAIAAGDTALRWQAPVPRKVLYVDGEMPLESLQQRLAAVVGSADKQAEPENFKLLAADHQDFGLPDLATIDGQAKMEPYLDGVQFLVLDNLSTLVRSGKENEAECWTLIQEWLLDLRRRGIASCSSTMPAKMGSNAAPARKRTCWIP